MEEVYQAKELSMAWCIDCHRNPEPHLRPVEFVTKLDWEPQGEDGQELTAEQKQQYGAQLKEEKHINPQVHCAVCHR
jgi:mono/diheme cytochrome c family protein